MKRYTRKELVDIFTPYVIAHNGIDKGKVCLNSEEDLKDIDKGKVCLNSEEALKGTDSGKVNLTVTLIRNLSTRYNLPTVRTVQRAFGTIEAFREALGLPPPKKQSQKPKKPLYEVIMSAYLFLKQSEGDWNVQRQYRYDDSSLPFPIGVKSEGNKTNLFEFIDALTVADLEKETARLIKKHKHINDPTRFFSRAFNVWIVNINKEAKIKIENGILPKQWTIISTEEFRNLFNK